MKGFDRFSGDHDWRRHNGRLPAEEGVKRAIYRFSWALLSTLYDYGGKHAGRWGLESLRPEEILARIKRRPGLYLSAPRDLLERMERAVSEGREGDALDSLDEMLRQMPRCASCGEPLPPEARKGRLPIIDGRPYCLSCAAHLLTKIPGVRVLSLDPAMVELFFALDPPSDFVSLGSEWGADPKLN